MLTFAQKIAWALIGIKDCVEVNTVCCYHVLCLLLASENKVLLTDAELVVVTAGGECVTVFLYSRMWMAELCRDWVW